MSFRNSIVNTQDVIDPSRTITLRNAFANSIKTRFGVFKKNLVDVLVTDDVFGLVGNRRPGQGAFAFPNSSAKVTAFMKWIDEQIINDILQVTQIEQVIVSTNATWMNPYIHDAYKKGVIKARTQLIHTPAEVNEELDLSVNKKPKSKIKRPPTLSRTGGVEASLMLPTHLERLSMLYSRTFSELKGVTDTMSQLISRILAEGLINGVSPKILAKQIHQVITGTGEDLSLVDSLGRFIPSQVRAQMIARTEIIRAHAEAQLTEFESWGVFGVVAKAEILTTKDQRTCPKCSRLEKSVMTIEEARGTIPVHPLCRCIWIPFIEIEK